MPVVGAVPSLAAEVLTAVTGSETELEMELQACFVATTVVEFVAAVKQDIEVLLGLEMVVGPKVCGTLFEARFS